MWRCCWAASRWYRAFPVLDPELALALFVAPVLVDAAARQRLFSLRADGTISDAAFQRVEEELDWAELDWARVTGERAGG